MEGGGGRTSQGAPWDICSQRITFETLPPLTSRASNKPSDAWCEKPHHITAWSAATTEATGPLLMQFMFSGFPIWRNANCGTEQKVSTGTIYIPMEILSLSKRVVLKVWSPEQVLAASGKWFEMQTLEPHPWSTEANILDLTSKPYKYSAPSQWDTHISPRVL